MKIPEARLKKIERSVRERIADRTLTLDLNDDELRLLMSASKSSGLDPDILVTRLVRNWLGSRSE